MYVHAKIFIYDKETLEQAIRDAFKQHQTPQDFRSSVNIVIDRYGNEDFLLTEGQLQQLQQEGITKIICDKDQIINYAHSCISIETLKKIMDFQIRK